MGAQTKDKPEDHISPAQYITHGVRIEPGSDAERQALEAFAWEHAHLHPDYRERLMAEAMADPVGTAILGFAITPQMVEVEQGGSIHRPEETQKTKKALLYQVLAAGPEVKNPKIVPGAQIFSVACAADVAEFESSGSYAYIPEKFIRGVLSEEQWRRAAEFAQLHMTNKKRQANGLPPIESMSEIAE